MALIHNGIIRGLNSILLQSRYINSSQAPNFIGYSLSWLDFVHHHHSTEEEFMFPAIAAATHNPDIMKVNINQHHSFAAGMAEMDGYLLSVQGKPDTFSGEKLKKIIDSFAPDLMIHLEAEIETMVALKSYGEGTVDLEKIAMETVVEARKRMIGGTGIPFLTTALDKTAEGGKYAWFPPGPCRPELFEGERTRGFWRFAPCTPERMPKSMPEVGDVGI